MKLNFVFLLLLSSNLLQPIIAQRHGNVSVEIGVPINEFHEKLKDVSGGGKFALYFPIKKQSPFFLGGGLGFGVFGSNTQMIHEDLTVYAGSTLIDVIPVDFRVTTSNNFFNGHFSFRYKYRGKIVQPYAETRIGFNSFSTQTAIYDETPNRMFTYDQPSNKLNSSTQSTSFTYSVGGEGGLIFKFGCVGLNIGVAYLLGGEAEYYSKNQINQWTVSFDGNPQDWNSDAIDPTTVDLNSPAIPLKSRTDMLLCTAGFTFGLCDAKAKTKTTKKTTTKPQTQSAPKPKSTTPKKVTSKPPIPPMPQINQQGTTPKSPNK